jgi:hypothetical protein
MNEMNSGLAALAPATGAAPTEPKAGIPRQSMEEIIAAARKMSDAQLADVLAGKSMELPQYVAMAEAMGRKQLRLAMQGAQAQNQSQMPSIKDQMLAEAGMLPQQLPQPMQGAMPAQARLPEDQGIGALPAPNMEQMGMAGGGIIAFDKGGVAKTPKWIESLPEGSLLRKYYSTVANWQGPISKADERLREQAALRSLGDEAVASSALQAAPAQQPIPAPAAQPAPVQEQPVPPVAPPQPAAVPQQQAPAPAQVPEEVTDRFAQFDQTGEDLDKSLAEQRQQTQGAFLMQIGASLLTSPTLAEGLGKGTQQALPMLVSNQREAKKLQQDSRDFRFNLTKAREAAEMGKEELALKYQDTASQIAYRAGILATKGTEKGISQKDLASMVQRAKTEALKAPGAALRYSQMNEADKAEFDRNIMNQVLGTVNALSGGGGNIGPSAPSFDRDALLQELAKRGVTP